MVGGKLKSFTQRLSCDTRIVTGLAAMYLWTWLIYWGGPFSLRGYSIELTNARWGVNVIMGAVAVGVVLFLACRSHTNQARLMTGVRLAAMLCGLAGIGTGLLLIAHFPLPAGLVEPVALVSGLFTGLTEGLLLCQWCSQTAALGVRTALFHNAIALLFGGVAFLVCNVVPAVFALVVGFVCPGVGFWAGQRAATHPMGLPYEDEEKNAVFAAAPGPATPSEAPRTPLATLLHDRAFLMLAGLAFVFGLSNGFINAGFEVVPEELYRISCFGVVIGTILASGLTFLAAFALNYKNAFTKWLLIFIMCNEVCYCCTKSSFMLLRQLPADRQPPVSQYLLQLRQGPHQTVRCLVNDQGPAFFLQLCQHLLPIFFLCRQKSLKAETSGRQTRQRQRRNTGTGSRQRSHRLPLFLADPDQILSRI